MAGYDRAAARARSARVERRTGALVVRADVSVAASTVQPALAVRAEWTLTASGHLGVRLRARRAEGFPALPRFGLRYHNDCHVFFIDSVNKRIHFAGRLRIKPCDGFVQKQNSPGGTERSCKQQQFH